MSFWELGEAPKARRWPFFRKAPASTADALQFSEN